MSCVGVVAEWDGNSSMLYGILSKIGVDEGKLKVWMGIGYMLDLRQREFDFNYAANSNSKGNNF